MSRTKTYRVVNNRMQFRCPECGTRKYIAVPPDVRRRSVRCTKCGARNNCLLNRRNIPRDSQAGKAVLVLPDGREIEIDLHDLSMKGIGFDLPLGVAKKLHVKQVVSFKCTWNPRLIGNNRYEIKSIHGRRVGAEKGINRTAFCQSL